MYQQAIPLSHPVSLLISELLLILEGAFCNDHGTLKGFLKHAAPYLMCVIFCGPGFGKKPIEHVVGHDGGGGCAKQVLGT